MLDDCWIDRWINHDNKLYPIFYNTHSKTKLPLIGKKKLKCHFNFLAMISWSEPNNIEIHSFCRSGVGIAELMSWRERVLRFSQMLIRRLQSSFWNFLDQPSEITDKLITSDYPSHLFIAKTDHILKMKIYHRAWPRSVANPYSSIKPIEYNCFKVTLRQSLQTLIIVPRKLRLFAQLKGILHIVGLQDPDWERGLIKSDCVQLQKSKHAVPLKNTADLSSSWPSCRAQFKCYWS